MPQINDYADYDVLKTPGLYTIINKSSGTVLDLSNCNPAPDTTIIGFKHHGRDNQKWQIAAVGEQKYLIICKATGSYVRATKDGGAVKSSVGNPDHSDVHWRITTPFASDPQLIAFQSISYQGAVLELKDGSEADGTEVRAYAQNLSRNGQLWLVKKITS